MDRKRFALVAFLVLLTRLPFLLPGHGTDPDAWRAAWASHVIAETGKYEASRFPGNPVHEFAGALLGRGGPLAMNGASALFSALAAGFFALILRRLGSRDDVLGALALASAPALALASVQTMDYAWTLAFTLAALFFALHGRAIPAGAALGLAIGCRLAALLWLVPVGMALAHASPAPLKLRRPLLAAGVALAVAALAFLPVFLTYGPGFFRFYQTGYPAALFLIKHFTVDLWGVPGTLALGFVVAAGLTGRRSPRRESALPGSSPRLTAAWWITLALVVLVYLRLPVKAFYLIPAVPLVLLLVAHHLGRRAFVVVCVATLFSPWLLKLVQENSSEAPRQGFGVVSLRPLGQPWRLDVVRGPLPTERQRRIERSRYVGRVLAAAQQLEGEHVVVCWDWLPEIRVRMDGKQAGSVRFTYLIDANELGELQRRGVRVHALESVEWENEHVHGIRLSERGVRPLLQ